MTTETLIYGLPKGETERHAEVLLYGGGRKLSEYDVRKVLGAASKDGFHSFRVTGFKAGTFPDFGSAVLRKTNPVKTTTERKPTPAQMAARDRFAEMARSGAFKKAGATRRRANPAMPAAGRRGNPAAANLYMVSRADALGRPIYLIAHFRKLAEAKQYAQAFADTNKTGVVITSKAL